MIQVVERQQRPREFSWIWLSKADYFDHYLLLSSQLPASSLIQSVCVCACVCVYVCVCVCVGFLAWEPGIFHVPLTLRFFGFFFPLFTQSPSTTPRFLLHRRLLSLLCYLCSDSSIHSFATMFLWCVCAHLCARSERKGLKWLLESWSDCKVFGDNNKYTHRNTPGVFNISPAGRRNGSPNTLLIFLREKERRWR